MKIEPWKKTTLGHWEIWVHSEVHGIPIHAMYYLRDDEYNNYEVRKIAENKALELLEKERLKHVQP